MQMNIGLVIFVVAGLMLVARFIGYKYGEQTGYQRGWTAGYKNGWDRGIEAERRSTEENLDESTLETKNTQHHAS